MSTKNVKITNNNVEERGDHFQHRTESSIIVNECVDGN